MDGLYELDLIGKLTGGKYRLESILGRGGMGTVYRATHTWTGRPVAVKLLHHEHAHDAASVARFLREARAASTVRHPNLVDVLDMGQDQDGSAYLVLELLEGHTLGHQLAMHGAMPLEEAARYLVPVLEALEELHRAGVVHRDFKPANIFLARGPKGTMVPKLLDFGVAKVLGPGEGLMTTTGIVIGTPAYMAPEQAAGNGNIGPWTDVWAAGAVLFECLTNELPFSAPTPSLMLVDVMTKPAPRMADKRADLSAEVCAVVDMALAKDPADRFPSVAALLEALTSAAGLTGWLAQGVPSSRAPVAFADTHQMLSTPAPGHASTQRAEAGPNREPAAMGATSTGRMRARQRPALFAGLALVVAVCALGAFALTRPPDESATDAAARGPARVAEPAAAQADIAPAPVAPEASPALAQPVLVPAAAAAEPEAIGAGAPAQPEEPKRKHSRSARPHRSSSRTPVATVAPDAPAPSPSSTDSDDPQAPRVEREW